MIHTFSVEAAKEFGLLPAILLNHINYWVTHNEANGKGYHDGTYWTYNSNKAFSELFPYASKNQINYALNKLKDAGAIMVGNYNKAAYDRTLWYAVTDYGKSFLEISENHFGNFRNGDEKFQKPIPDINTDNNKNNKPYKSGGKKIPPTLEEVKDYCEERNSPIDPEYFFDYYEGLNWMRGKTKVKDWQATLRTWERREHDGQKRAEKDEGGTGGNSIDYNQFIDVQ